MNKERQEWGIKLYARDERIIVTWKRISVKQGT